MTKEALRLQFYQFTEEELIDELLRFGQAKIIQKDQEIVDYGQAIPGIPLLLSGSIKIMREDDKGNELLLYYVESGDTCAMTLSCCMHNATSEIRAVAEEETEVFIVPLAKMEEWLIKYGSWRRFILNSYQNRLSELLQAVDTIAFKNLDERLWLYLVDKVKISGNMDLQLTHHQIADELNSSRVVISRLLKQLEQTGKVILHRNKIELTTF